MFTIPVNTFLESITGDLKKCHFYRSIFIKKAELILQRPSGEDSDNVLTGMVNR